jgi:hypothetical protein
MQKQVAMALMEQSLMGWIPLAMICRQMLLAETGIGSSFLPQRPLSAVDHLILPSVSVQA